MAAWQEKRSVRVYVILILTNMHPVCGGVGGGVAREELNVTLKQKSKNTKKREQEVFTHMVDVRKDFRGHKRGHMYERKSQDGHKQIRCYICCGSERKTRC